MKPLCPTVGTIVRLAASTGLALVLAAAPLTLDLAGPGLEAPTAVAKGGGNGGGGGSGGGGGNGGGNGGGGNGGGNAGGVGASASSSGGGGNSDGSANGLGVGGTPPGHDDDAAAASVGNRDAKGTPPGLDKKSDAAVAATTAEGRAAHASKLGKLNAAHASPTALANAAPNSTVGLLAAYKEAVESGITVDEATAQLSDISNKEVSPAVAATVNDLLGVTNDETGTIGDGGAGTEPSS